MNIHEYQAKNILKEFGANVPNGIIILSKDEIEKKAKKLNSKNLAIKAQIHAGGRGKAGGNKLVNNYKDLIEESNKHRAIDLLNNQSINKQYKDLKPGTTLNKNDFENLSLKDLWKISKIYIK